MTQLWSETQNKWIFLRSALTNLNINNNDQTYLKQIFIKFQENDENFRVNLFELFSYIYTYIKIISNRIFKN